MSRLSRLVKLVSLGPDLFFITRTRHRRLLFTTPKPDTLLKRRQISISSGGRPIDPIKPTTTSMETESSAIEDPAHDFVTVDRPPEEAPLQAESPAPGSPRFGAVEGRESAEAATVEGEGRPRSDDGQESSGVEYLDSEERRTLPEELLRSVVVLTCESVDGGTCDVYLVGTAHVSQDSCREVQAVISHLRPQVVFLELCPSRVAILTLKDLKVPTMSEMIDMWKKKQNTFGIIYSWFLAKVADKLEVLPGSEFRVGYEEAKEWGSKVILGDRPVNVTLRRTWGKMSLWHKTKLLYSFLFQAVFLPSAEDINKMLLEMNDNDMLTLVVQEMSKQFPTLMETLVDERDQYMSSTLLRVASHHHSVVAVVGKGHLQGIKKYWMQPIEMEKLMEIPSTSRSNSTRKIVKSLGFAAVGVAIVAGVYLAAKKRS